MSARHGRHECNTGDTSATPTQHQSGTSDKSATRIKPEKHECDTNEKF